ncbi:MAG: HRDC domain-containing protein [Deltaproteobacteria bacterium]|nr:HRDC domain-containing protein [Deltaproteobacteria bacterium]
MTEIRVLTVPLDPRTGLFDDGPVRAYLADREVLRAEPHFFVHEGRPCWSVYLETRLRQGADASAARPPGTAASAAAPHDPEREAFLRLLSELDETERARYDRLLQWRREAARREGVPHYVLLTNRQALDLARRAPRSLAGVGQTRGVGKRRVDQHGREILEVLHGPEPARGSERPDPVRADLAGVGQRVPGRARPPRGARPQVRGVRQVHGRRRGVRAPQGGPVGSCCRGACDLRGQAAPGREGRGDRGRARGRGRALARVPPLSRPGAPRRGGPGAVRAESSGEHEARRGL